MDSYPVRRILDLSMTDPSLLGILIFDLSVHLLLIFAYDGKYTWIHLFVKSIILNSLKC